MEDTASCETQFVWAELRKVESTALREMETNNFSLSYKELDMVAYR